MAMNQDNVEEPVQMQAQSIIVIHPGSLYLRIGRASDLNPHTELHAVARKRLPGGVYHRDTLLPPVIPKMKDVEQDMDTCRLQLSHTLQSCIMSDGSRRYATTPQQLAVFNKRSIPELLSPFGPDWCKLEGDVLVGDEVLNLDPSLEYNVHYPIKRGDLNVHPGVGGSLTGVIADLRCIWSWVIVNKLKIPLSDLKNYRAVLIIPDIYNRLYLKELMTLIMQMGFSSGFLLQDHVAATFGAGIGSACVVDCGHGKTSISCVEDGITKPATRVRLPYGGGDITQAFHWLLHKCGFPYKDCQPDENPLDAVLLETLKQDFCHVDLDVCSCQEKSFIIRQPTSPVLQYVIQVADECMIAPLGFFAPELLSLTGPKTPSTQKRNTGDPCDPHDADYLRETGRKSAKEAQEAVPEGIPLGVDEEIVDIEVSGDSEFITAPGQLMSLDQAVLQSIQRCGSDELKKKMYSCILVVGGGMKFKGIHSWLQSKISLQIPHFYRSDQMDIVTWPKEMDPVMTAWKGAAIMACLESAHELWISPHEWEKHSVKILRERAPFIW